MDNKLTDVVARRWMVLLLCSDNRLALTGLRPSAAYSVVVEARKTRKHDSVSEGKWLTLTTVSGVIACRLHESIIMYYSCWNMAAVMYHFG